MTTDLITALQTHGQQHKGTDLGGLLQWAILHIQSQNEAIEELRRLRCLAYNAGGKRSDD